LEVRILDKDEIPRRGGETAVQSHALAMINRVMNDAVTSLPQFLVQYCTRAVFEAIIYHKNLTVLDTGRGHCRYNFRSPPSG
jgi:hypothetical protein